MKNLGIQINFAVPEWGTRYFSTLAFLHDNNKLSSNPN